MSSFRRRKGKRHEEGSMDMGPFRTMEPHLTQSEQGMLDQRLMSAVATGDLRQAGAALASGADPNAWNDGGMTPLMLAALSGREGIALALLGAKADPTAKIRSGMYAGWTASSFARYGGHMKLHETLLAREKEAADRKRAGPEDK